MPRLSTTTVSTDRDIRALKPSKRRSEYRIEGHRNLVLRVAPSGTKSFTSLFLSPATGRWRKIALGTFPNMLLDEAIGRAARVSVTVRDGIDPLQARATLSQITFGELADEYLAEHRKRRRPVSTDEVERYLKAEIRPYLKILRADAVRKLDVVRVVERVAKRGAFVSADRVLTIVRSIYNWAIATGRLETNPTLGMKKRNGRKPRDRILCDDEIRQLWRALDETPHMDMGIRDALKLQLLLGTRISETIGALKSEVDLKQNTWTLPGSRTKNGRDLRLPLSPMAAEIMGDAIRRAGASTWLFPGRKDGQPIKRKSAPIALLRLRTRIGMKQLGSHDLRRTLASGLDGMGVEEGVVGRILNHTPRNITGRVYIHTEKFDEMRAGLDAWSERLSKILAGQP